MLEGSVVKMTMKIWMALAVAVLAVVFVGQLVLVKRKWGHRDKTSNVIAYNHLRR